MRILIDNLAMLLGCLTIALVVTVTIFPKQRRDDHEN
jgi:hypothetical protein